MPALRELLDGTDAVAVTSIIEDGTHTGVVVSGAGVIGRQLQLHPVARLGDRVSRLGEGLATYDLPWGRLAVVVTSRAGFIRASLSPNAYVYSFERTARNLQVVSDATSGGAQRQGLRATSGVTCYVRVSRATTSPSSTSPVGTNPSRW